MPVLTEADVKIKAEPLATDPNTCRFTVNHVVHPGGPWAYRRKEEASGSPLAARLFALPGVASVVIAGDVVLVGRDDGVDWMQLMKPIGAALRAQLVSGEPSIADLPAPEPVPLGPLGRTRTDEEIVRAVQRVLDEAINPYVSTHGGNIALLKVDERIVYVEMSGGCQGCAASTATLRQGLEALLAEEVPEVEGLVDVTAHEDGASPYYTR
jgi:Fe-S cluster biogenesis protein NfuA